MDLRSLLGKVEESYKVRAVNLYSYLNLKSIRINSIVDGKDVEKRNAVENAIIIMNQLFRNSLKLVDTRLDKLEDAYNSLNYKFDCVNARLLYRGLVGVGDGFGRLAFEVGLSWDSILQLPFFPGSSVKGAVRAIARAVNDGEVDIGIDVKDEDWLERIFGSSEGVGAGMGTVVFHDAYPIEANEKGLILEPDVMTPIYKDSIEEHKAKPTPIIFLAIARGVKFCFPLASKYEGDLEIAKRCLVKALEYGIGAKTLVGYSVLLFSNLYVIIPSYEYKLSTLSASP